jgi:hypothetical protein
MEGTMDNSAPTVDVDNASPAETTSVASAAPAQTSGGGWKTGINTDLRNSPLLQKFEDTPEGLNKALESHANLEKLLGHEKVPIPKDVNDVEGWNRFSKAMGIPDKAEGYGLADAAIPESMKGMTLDKNKFAEIAHAHKLTPAQAKGLWETYARENISSYESAMKAHQEQLTKTVNTLKGEWGDAYQTNVELGQMVINKFSPDQETNDLMTAVVASDPRLIKAFAKIGEQFAENKVGEFQMKRFSLAPEEAESEIEKMVKDLDGPYMNQSNKWSSREHQAAIDRVNSLRASIQRAKG